MYRWARSKMDGSTAPFSSPSWPWSQLTCTHWSLPLDRWSNKSDSMTKKLLSLVPLSSFFCERSKPDSETGKCGTFVRVDMYREIIDDEWRAPPDKKKGIFSRVSSVDFSHVQQGQLDDNYCTHFNLLGLLFWLAQCWNWQMQGLRGPVSDCHVSGCWKKCRNIMQMETMGHLCGYKFKIPPICLHTPSIHSVWVRVSFKLFVCRTKRDLFADHYCDKSCWDHLPLGNFPLDY